MRYCGTEAVRQRSPVGLRETTRERHDDNEGPPKPNENAWGALCRAAGHVTGANHELRRASTQTTQPKKRAGNRKGNRQHIKGPRRRREEMVEASETAAQDARACCDYRITIQRSTLSRPGEETPERVPCPDPWSSRLGLLTRTQHQSQEQVAGSRQRRRTQQGKRATQWDAPLHDKITPGAD